MEDFKNPDTQNKPLTIDLLEKNKIWTTTKESAVKLKWIVIKPTFFSEREGNYTQEWITKLFSY
jgi:hypothetical protein